MCHLFDAIAPHDPDRKRLGVWLPVFLAIGIGLYFALPVEPAPAAYVAAALVMVVGALGWWRLPPVPAALAAVLIPLAAGFLAAGARSHAVAAPVIEGRYYGAVEGRIVAVDRSVSGALRVTLAPVHLKRRAPDATPTRVRVSLHGDQPAFDPAPGQWIALTASLSPPAGPTEPRGFDFQRMAWFDGLGAVGYTRDPVIRIAPQERGLDLLIHRLRRDLSLAIQSRVEGQAGAFAAAILTGDRSGVSEETKENLRLANLSHLLAISGLHMGLMTAAIYWIFLHVFSLLPRLAGPLRPRAAAALSAIAAGAFYLALSGFNVATERAFIMVCAFYIAIIVGRRALSLRAVALAATVILLRRPETLAEPGFQMSFAATTALVASFSALRDWTLARAPQVSYDEAPDAYARRSPAWSRTARIFGGLVMSSAVAGLATAPVAAAHFNRIADYGLIANIVSVPLMGLIIIPAALAALALAPLGLEALAFAVMAPAIRWILAVADTVSHWDGAVTYVPAPPPATLPLIGIGALMVALWRGRSRLAGAVPLVAGLALWITVERPALLVSADGGLIGVMQDGARVLNKDRGQGFAASTWLENDGTGATQVERARAGMDIVMLDGWTIAHITGRNRAERVEEACTRGNVVIVNDYIERDRVGPCEMFDLSKLRDSGALAFSVENGVLVLSTARGATGVRLWNTPALRASNPPPRADLIASLPDGALGARIELAPPTRLAAASRISKENRPEAGRFAAFLDFRRAQ